MRSTRRSTNRRLGALLAVAAGVLGGALAGAPQASAAAVIAHIPAGYGAADIGVDPVAREAFVSNSYAKTISVIDEPTNTVTATIPVADSPGQIAVDPGTAEVFVNLASTNIAVIDVHTNQVIRTFAAAAAGLAVDTRTHRLFVSDFGDKKRRAPGLAEYTEAGVGGIVARFPRRHLRKPSGRRPERSAGLRRSRCRQLLGRRRHGGGLRRAGAERHARHRHPR